VLVDLITLAIETRLNGTVGVALSGGLDSSVVACLSPTKLPTFTGYYNEEGYDERKWARLAAHPTHHEILISSKDFVENFDDMCKFLVPPIMGMGTFGQYMVSKYASNYVDVLLSGEGSDELFGGYARQMIVAGEAPPEGYENYKLPADYPTTLKEALDYDYERLPELLAVDDQMTGAFGIEARAPFTDPAIVAYGLTLPITERIGKRHLRNAVRGIVPDEIIDRKNKMGFPVPLVQWAQEEPIKTFVMDRIGYIPDVTKPWDRKWWYEICDVGMQCI